MTSGINQKICDPCLLHACKCSVCRFACFARPFASCQWCPAKVVLPFAPRHLCSAICVLPFVSCHSRPAIPVLLGAALCVCPAVCICCIAAHNHHKTLRTISVWGEGHPNFVLTIVVTCNSQFANLVSLAVECRVSKFLSCWVS